MDEAPQPPGFGEVRVYGVVEPGDSVGDDRLGPTEAPRGERSQKLHAGLRRFLRRYRVAEVDGHLRFHEPLDRLLGDEPGRRSEGGVEGLAPG